MPDLKDWLDSGHAAVIDGLALRPQPHPYSARMVLSTSKGQAEVYYLRDDVRGEWMLKKFHPGCAPDPANILAVQSLVPRDKGFEAAYLRRCLRRDMVSRTGYSPPELIEWIDGTILMPRVIAADWSEVVGNVRDGTRDLSLADRVTLAENLCARVEVLEEVQLAHRDLSATNVMLDTFLGIHLIDWDSLYSPSLQMPANTTVFTTGYAAPFIRERNDDPVSTWTSGGDRFALAVLILELFAAEPGCALTGDGGLLDQIELNARGGAGIGQALDAAAGRTSVVEPLFQRALQARAAIDCPSPREWLHALHQIVITRQSTRSQPASPHFVLLDLNLFVQLDHSRFINLYP